MLAGEQVMSVSAYGTLFLVPMTEGSPKPLPKSIRRQSSSSALHGSAYYSNGGRQPPHLLPAEDEAGGSAPSDDCFNTDAFRRRSIVPIQCVSSNFRLVLTPVQATSDDGAGGGGGGGHQPKRIAIPYMLVDRFELDLRAPKIFALTVYTKWTWVLRIQSALEEPIRTLAQTLERSFPRAMGQFFAFAYFNAMTQKATGLDAATAPHNAEAVAATDPSMQLSLLDGDGTFDTAWGALNLERELHRQTVLNCQPYVPDRMPLPLPPAGDPELQRYGCGKNLLPWFHIVTLQRQDIFFSYPTRVVVPRKVSVDLLEKCASYRQIGRVPVVTWVHGVNGATLSRAGQPKPGTRKPGKEDQMVCSYLNQSYHATNATAAATCTATTTTLPVPTTAASSSASTPPPPLTTHHQPPPSIVDNVVQAPQRLQTPPPRLPQQPPSLFEQHSSSASSADDDSDAEIAHSLGATGAGHNGTTKFYRVHHRNAVDPSTTTDVLANKSELRPLWFVDCRSRTAATANIATGGGFEIVRNYDRATIEFLGLDNIHALRDAFDKVRKLCVAMQMPHLDGPTSRSVHGSFHSRLEATGWVLLQERLLWASWKVATLLHSGASVLVHCTDGWDRTPQVVSLAKLQLDAHYRTVEGFCELIILEWLQMGHKFADRCGMERSGDEDEYVCLGSDGEEESDGEPGMSPRGDAPAPTPASLLGGGNGGGATAPGAPGGGAFAGLFASPQRSNKSHSPSSQIAPIFLQFIDAVTQLWNMFPQAFEFTPAFLQFVLEASYSCQFGTFLYNCHRMRTKKNGLVSKTISLWGVIETMVLRERMQPLQVPSDERMLNPFYRPQPSRCPPGTDAATVANVFHRQRIVPSYQAFRFKFWSSLYCRYQWEGTGCPSETDLMSPLYDAVLVLSEQIRRHHHHALGSGKGRGELVAASGDWCDIVSSSPPDADNAGATADAGTDGGRAMRVMFRHRVPLSHLTTEWQVVRKPLFSDPFEGGGATGGVPVMAASDGHGGGVPIVFRARNDTNACQICGAEFTLFFRRHTCRRCCRTACGNCANHFLAMPRNSIQLYEERDATHPVRLCTPCFQEMTRRPSINMAVAAVAASTNPGTPGCTPAPSPVST